MKKAAAFLTLSYANNVVKISFSSTENVSSVIRTANNVMRVGRNRNGWQGNTRKANGKWYNSFVVKLWLVASRAIAIPYSGAEGNGDGNGDEK